MLDPSKRFITGVLALGVIVLLASIAIGEHLGERVLGRTAEKRLTSVPVVAATLAPNEKSAPYGPDWKRSQVLAAATSPAFPDPRVRPVPLPASRPTPSPRPEAASPSPTPNLNLPIWRRAAPLPSALPTSQRVQASPVPVSRATPHP